MPFANYDLGTEKCASYAKGQYQVALDCFPHACPWVQAFPRTRSSSRTGWSGQGRSGLRPTETVVFVGPPTLLLRLVLQIILSEMLKDEVTELNTRQFAKIAYPHAA